MKKTKELENKLKEIEKQLDVLCTELETDIIGRYELLVNTNSENHPSVKKQREILLKKGYKFIKTKAPEFLINVKYIEIWEKYLGWQKI